MLMQLWNSHPFHLCLWKNILQTECFVIMVLTEIVTKTSVREGEISPFISTYMCVNSAKKQNITSFIALIWPGPMLLAMGITFHNSLIVVVSLTMLKKSLFYYVRNPKLLQRETVEVKPAWKSHLEWKFCS